MKMRMKMVALALVFALMLCVVPGEKASAKTLETVVVSVKGNTLTYYPAAFSTEIIPNASFENIVGYGKTKELTLTKKTKYNLLKKDSITETQKVKKKKFLKSLTKCKKNKENGSSYFSGSYFKIKVKGKKCLEITQGYQA